MKDLVEHDEHRRATMTREKYLARIYKIRTMDKLDAAESVAIRYGDTEAFEIIVKQRSELKYRSKVIRNLKPENHLEKELFEI